MAFGSVAFWNIDQDDVGAAEVFVQSGCWVGIDELGR